MLFYLDWSVYYRYMPRTTTGAKDRIIASAVKLLRQGGLASAGLNDVLMDAQAPRGSLYHYFPRGKGQMVEEALQSYRDLVAAQLTDALGPGKSLDARIDTLFDNVGRRLAGTEFLESCAVGAVVLDLRGSDDLLRTACQSILDQWAHVAAECFTELPSRKRATAGRTLVAMLEGAQLMARAHRNDGPLREAAGVFKAYVHSLRP